MHPALLSLAIQRGANKDLLWMSVQKGNAGNCNCLHAEGICSVGGEVW
jgi:hypothetical protein